MILSSTVAPDEIRVVGVDHAGARSVAIPITPDRTADQLLITYGWQRHGDWHTRHHGDTWTCIALIKPVKHLYRPRERG